MAAPLPELPGVPATIGQLYRSCLSEDPEDRPTASTAAAVLLVALTVRTPQPSDVAPRVGLPYNRSESVTLGTIADADRRRRRRRVVVLLAGLVAVLTATAFAMSNNSHNGANAFGSGPPTGRGVSPTAAHPSAGPGVGTPGRENPLQGGPTVFVTVTVTVPGGGGNPPVAHPGTLFSTTGGRVVAVCEGYAPLAAEITPNPGYSPNQLAIIVIAWVFFTKPAEGTNPAITYRLTITCPSGTGEPKVTVTSYVGDKLVTPSATPPTTTASAPPSA
jgi:hypothetical protein